MELPGRQVFEGMTLECLEALDKRGWDQPPEVYVTFLSEHRLAHVALPLPVMDRNVELGKFLLGLATAFNEEEPPYDEVLYSFVEERAIGFTAYSEIMVGGVGDMIGFDGEQIEASYRCRIAVGLDIMGRTYRAIHRRGDPEAVAVHGEHFESGLLPAALNLLTLAVAERTPWARQQWIQRIQSLKVLTTEEFEAKVSDEKVNNPTSGKIMGRD